MASSLSVAAVSKHPIVLAGLRRILCAAPDRFRVVDLSSHDGHLAGVDVILYDLENLADNRGEELDHLVRSNAVVLGLVRGPSDDLHPLARRLGIAGVIPMSLDAEQVYAALEAAVRGEPQDVRATRAGGPAADLSERELVVLAGVAEGLSNDEIAARHYLSVNTIKTYVRSAYRKVGAKNRSQAVAWYLDRHPPQAEEPGPDATTHSHGSPPHTPDPT